MDLGLAFELIRLDCQCLAGLFVCGVLGCNDYILGKYFNGGERLYHHHGLARRSHFVEVRSRYISLYALQLRLQIITT